LTYRSFGGGDGKGCDDALDWTGLAAGGDDALARRLRHHRVGSGISRACI